MNEQMTIFVVGSIVVPVVLAVIARVIPKAKAIASGDSLGEKFGVAVSVFGNGRIGKKAMDTIEEGPINTVLAFVMAFAVGFGKGMNRDKFDPMM
jgi:hypothetical protein